MRTRPKRLLPLICIMVFLLLFTAAVSFADVIIDNGGAGTSYTGTWSLSGGTNPYGASSLWSRNGTTYTFAMSGQSPGTYEVLMWWSGWSSRPTSVPVAINYTGGTSSITVNQQQNPGQWNSLGTFYFNGSGSVTITAASGDTLSTCADAVQFKFISSNTAPTAAIDSITPNPANPGQSVTFTGHGTDTEGTVTAYEWTSSIDGAIGTAASFSTSTLSAGTHTISFRVRDNEGLWSSAATRSLTVGTASTEVIIDNTDSQTSRTGTWTVSSAPDFWKTGSVWSRDGATFTWKFTAPQSGNYDVSMWWTTTSTRSPTIPVVIDHAGGSQTITVNQLQNAGQWNALGTFRFLQGTTYNVTMTSQANPTSTCADAVKFTFKTGLPIAEIDSVGPNPARIGETVTFTGHGTGTVAPVVAYEWKSSIDGIIGTEPTISTSSLSQGTHTITFKAGDESGAWSEAATRTLSVSFIIDNSDAQTSRTGTWGVSAATDCYGTDSLWSRDGTTFSWKFTPSSSGYYEVSIRWTTTSTRSSAIPVTVNHSGGSQTIIIDQLKDAGQWNNLGTYEFTAGTTYDITITSQPYPTSTCADAVGFVMTAAAPPAADFLVNTVEGNAPLTVEFTDQSLGTVTDWLWDFGDGTASSEKNPSHTYAAPGYYTVSLTVSNPAGSNTKTIPQYIHTITSLEHIYLGDGYAKDAVFIPNVKILLARLGAIQEGDNWVYQNPNTQRTFVIHVVTTPEGFVSALKQENAHIVWNGHSNYGLGGSFARGDEVYNQRIDDIRYIDDDRFTHISTPMVSVKMDGMQYGQAYPNWLPTFKNGTNGIMPYTFSEGLPPYNYYLTYRVKGEPALYKVELSDGTYLERFPDSGLPAWYSSSGLAPDSAANPEYFIVNNDTDFSRCDFTGTWPMATEDEANQEYEGYNYQYHDAGTGSNTATWNVLVRSPGYYQVAATWQSGSANASNAQYTVQHAGGYTTVEVDQRVKSGSGYVLGVFYFNKGSYTVRLTDNANGRVVADSVTLHSLSTALNSLDAEFSASVIAGTAPLAVSFTDYSLVSRNNGATIGSWFWDFGDGATSTGRNPVHTYSNPGVYTVALTVTDTTGVSDTEIKTGLVAVSSQATLRAQFAAKDRIVTTGTTVQFTDLSSGNVTGREWYFGDGTTSTQKNPTHTYATPGTYAVALAVSSPNGVDVKTGADYIRSFDSSQNSCADNSYHNKPHFYKSSGKHGKTILYGNTAVSENDLKYSRMFYSSCNSCNYYAGNFHRGILFCTTSDSDLYTALNYLEDYLSGMSDEAILQHLNTYQDIHEMINFNLKPPSMR